mmetsp:Transcript_38277/g.120519  ORF Transcript_38277/g.120519 Transcript_38277/m.120519 type:complete len:91 (-) Transcript_38277:2515-2787(-)
MPPRYQWGLKIWSFCKELFLILESTFLVTAVLDQIKCRDQCHFKDDRRISQTKGTMICRFMGLETKCPTRFPRWGEWFQEDHLPLVNQVN